MRKKMLVAAILSSSLLFPTNQVEANEHQDIRFRVLAHSDNEQDQAVKEKIYKQLQGELLKTFAVDNVWERELVIEKIEEQISEWEQLVQNALLDEGATYGATVRFEKHLFPTKITKDGTFPSGVFDTIVVTLGEGEGKNWWCSIFPDLCGQVLISGSKKGEKDSKETCETDLSPEKDLSDDAVKVDSAIVSWIQKAWKWIF